MRRGLPRKKAGGGLVAASSVPSFVPGSRKLCSVTLSRDTNTIPAAVHGVIFASLVDYLSARHGPAVVSEILSDQPVFLLSESYEDERLLALVTRASELTGTPERELVHEVGVFTAQQTFARLYPAFFAVAGGTRAFLLSVETLIHELVRATIPNASPPQLHAVRLGDDGVTIRYTSSRRLCALLAGLVEGTARHYGEEVQIDQTECMLRDDPACVFEIRVSPGKLAA
jgi:heme-NO-binding protein